jgi:hypothetical protein
MRRAECTTDSARPIFSRRLQRETLILKGINTFGRTKPGYPFVEHGNELIAGTVKRSDQCGCVMTYGHRITTAQACLKHAPLVITPRFVRIGILKMRLDACDVTFKSGKRASELSFGLLNFLIVALNLIIGVELNEHLLPV